MFSFCLFTIILMTFFVILTIIFSFIHVDDSCACGFLITGLIVGYFLWLWSGIAVIDAHFDVTVNIKQIEEKIDTGRK